MLELQNVTKAYAGFPPVINGFTLSFEEGKSFCLMAESGTGKTTLIKLIAGLLEPDSGKVIRNGSVSMVFQEDRLIESLTPVKNIAIATSLSEKAIQGSLSGILDTESCHKAVAELSGGQKRRVCLARAVLKDSDILLLDEPFTGLDDNTRKQCIEYILDNQNGRTLIISTHNSEDASLLNAKIIRLKEEEDE